jgi:hypothetical protein
MITLKAIYDKSVCQYQKKRYMVAARMIKKTKPLQPGANPFAVLSMVHRRDIFPYLVAIKSFSQHADPAQIIVVCDPSTRLRDRVLLQRHIPHLALHDAKEFHHPDLPVGGTWERLHAISHYTKQTYVVQLDSDTLTLKTPMAVLDGVRANTGFVIGEEVSQSLMTLTQTSIRSSQLHAHFDHVQCVFEANINQAELPEQSMYVRGCSGFTGFPKTDLMQQDLLDLSRRMRKLLQTRWADWGTEQVASNYLIANAQGTSPLPFPDYGTPDVIHENSAFIHFIGSMRFKNKLYRQTTKRSLRHLIATQH